MRGQWRRIVLSLMLMGIAAGLCALWQHTSDETYYWPELEAVSSYEDSYQFNPLPLIRAVNLLQRLGKEEALNVIDGYLRSPTHQNLESQGKIFLVLRVLFDVPAQTNRMPKMFVGLIPDEPPNWKLMPRYPIIIQEDIPLLVNVGVLLSGLPENPAEHVKYFRQYGKVRGTPLVPANDPLQAVDRLIKSLPLSIDGSINLKELQLRLEQQCLHLLASVYRKPREVLDLRRHVPYTFSGLSPQKVREEVSELKLHWDDRKQDYVSRQQGN